MSQIEQSAIRNRLLAALPPDAFAELAPALDPVGLAFGQTLHEPGQAIQAVHFPEGGMVSMIALLEDGHSVEVGVVGREGLVGLPVVLGGTTQLAVTWLIGVTGTIGLLAMPATARDDIG